MTSRDDISGEKNFAQNFQICGITKSKVVAKDSVIPFVIRGDYSLDEILFRRKEAYFATWLHSAVFHSRAKSIFKTARGTFICFLTCVRFYLFLFRRKFFLFGNQKSSYEKLSAGFRNLVKKSLSNFQYVCGIQYLYSATLPHFKSLTSRCLTLLVGIRKL